MTGSSGRKHPWLRWAIGAAAVLVVLLVGGPFVYIHFIEGPAPKPLALPATTKSKVPSTGAAIPPAGAWEATDSSTLGYRVHEVLVGQSQVAVGRTHSVSGSITLAGSSVTKATFTVQMATVHSNESQRDNQFDGRIMDVAEFPTSTFTLTSPIALGTTPRQGVTVSATATGQLTLHGQTHLITFPVSARYTGSDIDVQGSIPILFSTYDIENPSFGSFVTTDNHGTLEFLLVLRHGAS